MSPPSMPPSNNGPPLSSRHTTAPPEHTTHHCFLEYERILNVWTSASNRIDFTSWCWSAKGSLAGGWVCLERALDGRVASTSSECGRTQYTAASQKRTQRPNIISYVHIPPTKRCSALISNRLAFINECLSSHTKGWKSPPNVSFPRSGSDMLHRCALHWYALAFSACCTACNDTFNNDFEAPNPKHRAANNKQQQTRVRIYGSEFKLKALHKKNTARQSDASNSVL